MTVDNRYARKIWARGLTPNDKGKNISSVREDGYEWTMNLIGFEHFNKTTVLTVGEIDGGNFYDIDVPQSQELTVYDR